MSETATKISFCRICSAGCGLIMTVDGQGRVISMRGDRENQLSKGYACFKGLQAEASHHGPERLLRPLKRAADGSAREIGLEPALDEIGAALRRIIDADGPEAVALYCGNGAVQNTASLAMQRSFMAAIGSDQYFTSLTIDQSAKMVSYGRLGAWSAGLPEFDDMDLALMFGTNPMISHTALGFLAADPVKRLKIAKANGLKLIVVDPRFTETSAYADVALQPYPGQDPAIIGAMMRMILKNGWEDKAFCERWVGAEQMAALRRAVDPLEPEYAEQRAGLAPGQIMQVAEMFAVHSKTGCAYGATGPNMAPFSNLAQHLIEGLNVICGRFLREGQQVRRANPQDAPSVSRAEVVPPCRAWEAQGESRIRGVRSLFGERLTATLSDEILTPGKGRIRALIVDGGNPAVSWPDQSKALQALKALDLLVVIDPWPSHTAGLAHYVLPPLMQFEHSGLTSSIPGYALFPGAWAQYTPAILPPPAGAELAEGWYMLWSIAKRLGRQVVYDGKVPLDMSRRPANDELLAIQLQGSLTSLEALKAYPHGKNFDLDAVVQPPTPGANGRFAVMPPDVEQEMRDFIGSGDAAKRVGDGQRFSHLLANRRSRDMYNSNGMHVGPVRKRNPYNPAFLNPAELQALDIEVGELIELVSAHGCTRAVAAADPGVREGVVSMSHGWGEPAEHDADPLRHGSCVNVLTDTTSRVEPINAMPHMSAVPINVRRVAAR